MKNYKTLILIAYILITVLLLKSHKNKKIYENLKIENNNLKEHQIKQDEKNNQLNHNLEYAIIKRREIEVMYIEYIQNQELIIK